MPTVNYNYLAQFAPGTYHPTFDPTGALPANLVTGEVHTITPANNRDFHFVVPLFAPFFAHPGSLVVTFIPPTGPNRVLIEGEDYLTAFEFIGASRGCSKPVYGGISFLNNQLTGKIQLSYRTIGGNWCLSLPEITQILANYVNNPRIIAWEQVTNYPTYFPVIDHEWNLVDMVGMSAVVESLNDVATAIAARPVPVLPVDLTTHLLDFQNPHQTTKAQVGLGLANNYATATNAQTVDGTATNLHTTPAGVAAALAANSALLQLELEGHISDQNNPHGTTKAQVGLGSVNNFDIASIPEAQAHVLNTRYMTPASTWAEITTALAAGTFNVSFLNAAFVGAVTVTGQVRAANGTGASAGHGFSFAGEGAFDSGMFSAADNVIDMYSSGVLQMRFSEAAQEINNFRPMRGSSTGVWMAAQGTGNGSFICKASGTGDGNLAGMTFWNDAYAIKMGVRADGYFGLGGFSRAPWSLYSDTGGNLVAAGNVTAYSDPRLKENQRPIEDAMALIRQLSGQYFTWKKGIAHTLVKAGKEDIGVMADEVLKVFPQIVYKSISLTVDGEEGVTYNMVAYEKLVPVLIEGLKNVDSRVIELEEKLAASTAANERLLKQMTQMQTAFEGMGKRLSTLERLID